ncbi:flagellar basal-body rod modification protein FlgD [Natronospira proteinivora]|uniref:Basal-body rod modification protein FlgD n=1 Tax=Natronospira proteinivora TaxID=1807133 RepID=A0ABT1G547_9GAMM|nr:flagellar hook assembly protein FlgD [Natronospira proteinivora]MCP1726416.1 flagellar basal-body rod modification protein FlgD [Natronospira proteinivora]
MISASGTNPFEQFGIRGSGEGNNGGKGNDELGQEQFLTLMIAQFQNQDPFEPMENGEFLGQLAQFSTVSGITELKDAFGDLSGAMQSSQALQASDLVGRNVLAESSEGLLPLEGGGVEGAVNLEDSANDVVVDVLDANGDRVRRMHLGQHSEGMARFHWDGMTDEGEAAEPGAYQFEAGVVRGESTEAGQILVNQHVESVTLDRSGKGVTLNTALGELKLQDVYEFL